MGESNANDVEEQFEDEEKESRPKALSNGDTEIPTMQVNALQTETEHKPFPSQNTDNDRRGGAGIEPSALNNFAQQNAYLANGMANIPENHAENTLVDAQGDVHVNRYYNQTRNA